MQSNVQISPQNPLSGPANQAGGYMYNALKSATFETDLPLGATGLYPFHGVEFQPSETCPRNFIIFDQTDNKRQIMFHPAIGSRFCYPSLNAWAASDEHNDNFFANNEQREVTSFEEDPYDINVLLSLDGEENEECDEEELSTARTDAQCGSNSPDSFSNYESPPKKSRLTYLTKTSRGVDSCNDRKRDRIKKMIKALRSIVPGASQMNSVAILDDAVRYLKSLKLEAQKLGVGKLKSYT